MTRPKILIIDDNEQDQKIIRRYLLKEGFQDIESADCGEKGVETALAVKPDIILIDTMMPGIDGFETCRRLRETHRVSARIIIMTGRIDAVDAGRAREKGADDYCVKTSDCSVLIESLRKLEGPSPAAPAPAVPEEEKPAVPPPREMPDSHWGLEKTNRLIKELYKELEKKNEELKKLDQLKSEFVATVSHELRTPLTIIKGAISQILEGLYGPVNDEQKDKLSMALRSSELLRRIISDLLDIAKLEEKKVELHKARFDLAALAGDVVASFANLARERGLDVRLAAQPGGLEVEADRDRITQVLTNLVGNAVKFTEKGHVQVTLAGEPRLAICRVADTGRGIAADDIPKVFDKFQQFGKTYTKGQEGTGLGLSICRSIVELHKGNIWVKSTLGQGTEFVFTLPR